MKRSGLAGLASVLLVTCLTSSASAMYHPSLGRFLTRDLAGYSDGMGLYEYVGSSPKSLADPSGLQYGDALGILRWTSESDHLFGDREEAYINDQVRDLRLAAAAARKLWGWTYAPFLLEHALDGGGDVGFGEKGKFAKDLSKALRDRGASAYEEHLAAAVDALRPPLECERMDAVFFPLDLTGVTFSTGELQAAARIPDKIRCNSSGVVRKRCDAQGCCESYKYSGSMLCMLRDRYDYHERTEDFGTVKNAMWDAAWRAQKAARLTPFTL